MKKPLLIALLICVLLPSWSSAEILGGTFEINPFAGYCTSANSPEFCHKKIIGLRLGYNMTDRWEIEAAYSKVASSAELLGVDLLYHLAPEKRFTPFILAGIGNAHVSPKNKDSYNTLMGDIGAGFKYSLSNCMSFRSEVRNVVTHSNNVIVSAGLTFTLGKKAPKAAPPVPEPAPAPKLQPLPEPKPEIKPEPIAAPKPQPEPKPEPVPAPKAEPIKIILEDVHFGNNKYSLTPEAKEILKRDIMKLRENPGLEIEIQGHTSAIGTDDYNMKLSIKRANTVKDYLIKEGGIAAERLSAKGYGETMLEMPEPRPRRESPAAKTNRRVHFEIKVK